MFATGCGSWPGFGAPDPSGPKQCQQASRGEEQERGAEGRPQGLRLILYAAVSLQELREVSALWNEADRTWPVYQQQVEQTRAERAAWEGWSAGEDQPPLQVLSGIDPADKSRRPLSQGASSAGLRGWEQDGQRAARQGLACSSPGGELGISPAGRRVAGSRGLAGPSLLLARAYSRALDRGPVGNSPVLPAVLLTLSPLWQRFASASVWAPRPPAQPRGLQVGRRWRKHVDPLPGSKMGTVTKLALHAE